MPARAIFTLTLLAAMLLSFWPGAGPIGSRPASAASYRIVSVEVQGNDRIDASTVISYLALPKGRPVTDGELQRAYERLVDTGLFETVEMVPAGNRLIVIVRERPMIFRVSFEGNRTLKDEDLAKLVRSQPRQIYSPRRAEADAEEIVKAYRQAGRLAATVTPKVIPRSGNRIDLVFEIGEGGVVEIERISFVGNRAFSDRRLRRVIASKQAGLLRRIITSDTFISDRIAFDSQLLRDFYLSRGYIDFEVISVTPELAPDRKGYFLTFRVHEGQQYRFGKITVTSDLPEIDVETYRRLVPIREGKVYTPVLVDRTIERLENQAIRDGLDFVRAEPRITRNDENLTLDVEFALVRGPRIFVERIDIEGNTTTLDRVIRQRFRLVEGDPFNPREIRQAAERIRALGFFKDVKLSTREGSGPESVIVDVNVEEQPTGSISLGLSYSIQSGAAIAFRFSERNFLGRGQQVTLSLDTGTDNRTLGASFVEPALLGRDLSLSLSLFNYTTTQMSAAYDTDIWDFGIGLGFPGGERSRWKLSYGLRREDITNVNSLSPIILRDAGAVISSSLGWEWSWDTDRAPIDPTRRAMLRLGQQVAGLGGDAKYVKTTALALGEMQVWNEEVTLRAVAEGGAILGFGGYRPRITERFSLSTSQLRGFERNGVGPRDTSVASNDALGGKFYAAARLEAEFPIGLPEEYGISGGLFLDLGSLWGVDDPGTVDDGFHLRSAAGFSVFWSTPIGPLRFNFSVPIKKMPYDRTQNFDFTISTQF